MDPDVTWGNGRGCLLVVHYWADLQSVHGFRCCDNIAQTQNVSESCTRSICLVVYIFGYSAAKFDILTNMSYILSLYLRRL